MKKTVNLFITSIRHLLTSFFGFFGYNRKGKFAKFVWRTFATSACIAMILSACDISYHIYRQIRAEQSYERFMASDGERISRNIYYVSNYDDRGGYVMDISTGKKLIKNVAWIAKPLWNDSLVCYSNGKLRGYFRKADGKVIIPPRFEHAWVFSDGMAAIEENGMIKFIDGTGKIILDNGLRWNGDTEGYVFHGGFLIVSSSDKQKFGLMNRRGEFVLPIEYDDINVSCNMKYWRVRKGEQTAVYDEHLDLVLPFCDGYTYFTDEGFYLVRPDHSVCCYDYSGKVINDFCIFAMRHLEYETDELIYKGEVYTDDDGNSQAYFSESHKMATARLRAYVAGDFYEGLMTADGRMVTMPFYKNIIAVGPDLYLCEVSDDYNVLVNGRGEVVR